MTETTIGEAQLSFWSAQADTPGAPAPPGGDQPVEDDVDDDGRAARTTQGAAQAATSESGRSGGCEDYGE